MYEQQIEKTTSPQTEQPAVSAQEGQEQPENKSRKGAMAAILICAIVLLCLQAVLMILYLSGIITLFGYSLDVVMILEIIEDLVRFNKASAYYILSSFAFAIIYVVMFIFMVKTFIQSLRCCTYLAKKTPEDKRIALVEFSERLSEMFFLHTCIPIAIASLMGEVTLSRAAVAMLVLIPLAQIAEYAVEQLTLEKRPHAAEFLLGLGKKALLYAVSCLLVVFLRTPVFHDFIRGAGILFNGNIAFGNGFFAFLHLFYAHIVLPVLYIFMLAFSYRVIAIALLDPPELRKRRTKGAIKRAVIFSGVLLGMQLVFGAFFANALDGISFSIFKDWFILVRNSYLPVFLLLLGCMLLDNLWTDHTAPAVAARPAATNAG